MRPPEKCAICGGLTQTRRTLAGPAHLPGSCVISKQERAVLEAVKVWLDASQGAADAGQERAAVRKSGQTVRSTRSAHLALEEVRAAELARRNAGRNR